MYKFKVKFVYYLFDTTIAKYSKLWYYMYNIKEITPITADCQLKIIFEIKK